MTPAIILNDLAAIARRVSESNLWVARGLRNSDGANNVMRKYARLAVRIGHVASVRSRLAERMTRQTPQAPHLIARALAIFDAEVERVGANQLA